MKKIKQMLSFMLDLRFKSLRLVSSFIGQDQAISIIEQYDQWSLFPMFLRCYHIFHLMA
jgi:hypothetical protein